MESPSPSASASERSAWRAGLELRERSAAEASFSAAAAAAALAMAWSTLRARGTGGRRICQPRLTGSACAAAASASAAAGSSSAGTSTFSSPRARFLKRPFSSRLPSSFFTCARDCTSAATGWMNSSVFVTVLTTVGCAKRGTGGLFTTVGCSSSTDLFFLTFLFFFFFFFFFFAAGSSGPAPTIAAGGSPSRSGSGALLSAALSPRCTPGPSDSTPASESPSPSSASSSSSAPSASSPFSPSSASSPSSPTSCSAASSSRSSSSSSTTGPQSSSPSSSSSTSPRASSYELSRSRCSMKAAMASDSVMAVLLGSSTTPVPSADGSAVTSAQPWPSAPTSGSSAATSAADDERLAACRSSSMSPGRTPEAADEARLAELPNSSTMSLGSRTGLLPGPSADGDAAAAFAGGRLSALALAPLLAEDTEGVEYAWSGCNASAKLNARRGSGGREEPRAGTACTSCSAGGSSWSTATNLAPRAAGPAECAKFSAARKLRPTAGAPGRGCFRHWLEVAASCGPFFSRGTARTKRRPPKSASILSRAF
mmetsp:Transcript_6616/g.16859  ORF Transcript_6616/g.16859 Transcript_6616/m.16859 type:complete len:541 (+) Transcript_6616:834-2456(+)